jgi:hypothetical protein
MINPGQDLNHMLEGPTRVDPGQHKIKVIIIIVLKLDSVVSSRQDPSHR